MRSVVDLLVVALAGGAGAVCRFVLATAIQERSGPRFPWGTLACNLGGCLVFGVVVALFEEQVGLGPRTRLALLTGFLGAFTTFSTYAYETGVRMNRVEWEVAALNLLANNAGGLACVLVGVALGRWCVGLMR